MKGLILFALSVFAGARLDAGLFDTNLIVNGNAEAGPGSVSGNDIETVPGWTTANGFTVASYGVASGIATNIPGPANRGTNYFAGGPNNGLSDAWQFIDLTPAAAEVDSGAALMELTGYLGGWSSQEDSAVLKAEFFDGINPTALAQAAIGPVTAEDRTNAIALLFRGTTNAVPAGARLAKLTLTMTRYAGSYNDGIADDLSLVLTINRPELTIQSGANPVVSWPVGAGAWQLQSATNLSGTPQWTDVGPPYQTNTGRIQFAEPAPAVSRFYRLQAP